MFGFVLASGVSTLNFDWRFLWGEREVEGFHSGQSLYTLRQIVLERQTTRDRATEAGLLR